MSEIPKHLKGAMWFDNYFDLPAHPTTLGNIWIGTTKPTPESIANIQRLQSTQEYPEPCITKGEE